jgi:hypothetical protein
MQLIGRKKLQMFGRKNCNLLTENVWPEKIATSQLEAKSAIGRKWHRFDSAISLFRGGHYILG